MNPYFFSKLVFSKLALLPLFILGLAFTPLALAHEIGGDNPRSGKFHLPIIYIAEQFGISVDTLREELKSGSDLEEIAEEYGVSEETLESVLDKVKDRGQKHPGKGKGPFIPLLKDEAIREHLAELLGVTDEELKEAKENGVSFKDFVEEHGWTIKDLVAALKEYKESLES